ncbi:SRPBCC domain-containing protein [Corallococcus sp. bb12-1]|uniref:SRPBCC domain-containing protein n=1 Tax=Corallococcus sp. bb12-1 TaxID=2996784 RepID=UPI00226D5B6A|nr:SRPBCC domain-containing protein [Corallococcus sp. bb12-1]MCY1044499.1 SRPBCC domain-containing protein [Corallococcus sp. bb12-1]
MTEFRTSIAIRSTPARIWSLLTDAGAYPGWNTTVEKVVGTIALGQKVTVHTRLAPQQAFPVRVAEFIPDKRMVWRGGMPLGFLFKGERTFDVSPQDDGTVEFTMREAFTGLLAPLITKSIPDLQPAFDEFAACLKKRAES